MACIARERRCRARQVALKLSRQPPTPSRRRAELLMRTACSILIGLSLYAGACQAQNIARNQEDLTKAISSAKPGDTIVMSDGVWKDASIVFSGEGEKDKPITLRAQTPG